MKRGEPLLLIRPGTSFEILVWANYLRHSQMLLSVLLDFPPDLRIPSREIHTRLDAENRDKTLKTSIHVDEKTRWNGVIRLGVLTVKSGNDVLAWQDLPKAEIASLTAEATSCLGIRLRIGTVTAVEYRVNA